MWKAPVRNARELLVIRRLLPVLLLLIGLAGPAASPVAADWVRDEIRINMRTGPGVQFRILRSLGSGDVVEPLGAQSDWVRVRTEDGEEGWVPGGYLVQEKPPSLRLPLVEAQLRRAEAQLEELRGELEAKTVAVTELDGLRSQVEKLETDNIRLVGSARWKMLLTGAGIVLVGMLLGVILPRGGSQRARRIKL